MENQPKDTEPTTEKVNIKRVLFLADFGCATGFAQVAHNIAAQVLSTKEYQIDVVGINYYGMPTEWQGLYPTVRVFPASLISGGDVFGRQGLLNLLASGAYDILFTLQDTFNIEPMAEKIIEVRNNLMSENKKAFKWIFYFPIDAKPKENWIRKSVLLANFPVAYTKYGYDECVAQVPEIASKLRIINHGTDTGIFKPMEKEAIADFRHRYFVGNADGKFLITNINRNQPRKDIPRTLQIFALLKKQVPDALLYLHMNKHDVGWGIDEAVREFELIPDKDYLIPKSFNEHDGLSLEVVNAIYNTSDLVMTTTLGEGWGLSMTEAMAAKCPVIAPDHTSLTEMLADGRGTLVGAGKRITDRVMLSQDNERMRPIVDVAEFVDKIVYLRNNPDVRAKQVETAYNYLVENWTWENIGKQWIQVFKEASETKFQLPGRNDACFCGSGKKYKHCHGDVRE